MSETPNAAAGDAAEQPPPTAVELLQQDVMCLQDSISVYRYALVEIAAGRCDDPKRLAIAILGDPKHWTELERAGLDDPIFEQ